MKFDRHGNVRCRVCGCTDYEPCNPPCAWYKNADLCTTCAAAARDLMNWRRQLAAWREAALRPNLAALTREVTLAEQIMEATRRNQETAARHAARQQPGARSKTR